MLNRKLLCTLALSLSIGTVSYAQEPDSNQVRQMFLASRRDPEQAGVRFTNRRTPRGTGRANSGTGIVRGSAGGFGAARVTSAVRTKPAQPASDPANPTADPPVAVATPSSAAVHATEMAGIEAPAGLGLGLTLFQRAAKGAPVRANPQLKFTTKDKFRLWLEPSTDGYLYVFRVENAGPPVLLFPTPELNNGRNLVYAHIPFEWPSVESNEEAKRWFGLSVEQATATTTFYAILAREPLAALPAAAKLAAYCEAHRNAAGQCQPDAETWKTFNALEKAGAVYTAADKFVAAPQQPTEQAATLTTRGYGLTPDEPAPHLVFLNSDLSQNTLWLKFSLTRK